ncbi:hypothetical protein H4R33_004905, partial [Dimargaris cristalligena]
MATSTPSVGSAEQSLLCPLDILARSGPDGQVSRQLSLPSSSDSGPNKFLSEYCPELFMDSEFPFQGSIQWDLDNYDDEHVQTSAGTWEGHSRWNDNCFEMVQNSSNNNRVEPSNGSEAGPTYKCPDVPSEVPDQGNSGSDFESVDSDESSVISCLQDIGMELAEYCAIYGTVDESSPAGVDCQTEDEYADVTVELSDTEACEVLVDVEGASSFIETQRVKCGDCDSKADAPASPEHISSEDAGNIDYNGVVKDHPAKVSDGGHSDTETDLKTMLEESPDIINQPLKGYRLVESL